MSQKAAGLHRKQKLWGNVRAPPGKCRSIRQPVERVVDFHRLESRRVILQPTIHGQIARVETPAP